MYPNDASADDPLIDKKSKAERLQRLQEEYQIPGYLSELIFVLEEYELYLVIDDSSSMNGYAGSGSTRWEELQEVVRIFLKIGLLVDNNGIDVAFMNRRFTGYDGKKTRFTKIHTESNINNLFSEKPFGITPSSETLTEVMAIHTQKPKIIIIATDGEPTDKKGRVCLKEFEEILTGRDHDKNFISVLFCSDDEHVLQTYLKWDRCIKNMDVLDDYDNEKKEVNAIQGSDFEYTMGYHVFRLIASSVIKELDDVNEKKLKFTKNGKLIWNHNNEKKKKKKNTLRSLFCCTQ